MNGFLLDENLPCRLRFQLPLPATHSTDLGDSVSDSDVWDYARKNGLVIITKDVDFSDRIAATQPPPWVIFGLLPSSKLINVYSDRIETLSY